MGNIKTTEEQKTNKRKRPTVKGTINDTKTEFLCDSGASISVISEAMFKSIWRSWEMEKLPLPQHIRVKGVTGHAIEILDYVQARITIMDRTFNRPILVVRGLKQTEAILGWDTITEEGMVF